MKSIAPYQLYFPLGILNAILAVGIWFTQDLQWFNTPAMLIHSKLIAGGFLWSFIVGFLMTAVPRMTGTTGANILEYLISGTILIAQTCSSWYSDPRFFYSFQMALVAFLVIFGGRRILKMTKPLPVFFSHVGMAMILAFAGAYYQFSGNSFMGIHLYHLGATLLLVLGIGTRFFSFLSGLPSEFENSTSRGLRIMFHVGGVLVMGLLFLAGQDHSLAYLGLAIVTLFYLFRIWQVQRASDRPSALKYAVRVVAAMIPLCFFLTWVQPLQFITWFHIIFIACFSLITFSVATRVTLAHGSYSIDLEKQSSALWFLLIFLVLGAVSRVLHGFSEGLWRKSYLHSAVIFWILAVICWCWAFLPRIFKPGPMAKPSC